MADGTAGGVADNLLGLMLNGASFSGFSALYVQLHTGAPGPAGTANVAGNSARQAAGAFVRASAGSWQNSVSVLWLSVSTTETYSHFSLWSASSGGTFVQSGAMAGGSVTSGQNFQILPASLTVAMPVAA